MATNAGLETMQDAVLTGGCFCGAVRYECGALIYPPTFCHCETCRGASGAHVVAWLTVAADTFVFVGAHPVEFASSPGVFRTFCGRCGTSLTYRRQERPGEVDVTVASLDRPSEVVPTSHIYMDDAVAWDRPEDGLPQYPGSRE